jgi:hypothetical protein
MLTDYDEGKKLANIALAKLRKEDIIHRGFLRPLEIALKTRSSEPNHPLSSRIAPEHQHFLPEEETQGHLAPNSLPCGLRIAVKQSICDNRFTLKDVTALEETASF